MGNFMRRDTLRDVKIFIAVIKRRDIRRVISVVIMASIFGGR